MPAATLTLSDAASQNWDVLVVGAGPAGAMAAREAARRGVKVLLVDRAHFPRHKVCGACLNGWTLATLSAVGLGALVANLGAVPLRDMHLQAWGRQATFPLLDSMALSREALDASLIDAAIEYGVHFLPSTLARLESVKFDSRSVHLRQADQEISATAKVVLAADGLAGTLRTSDRTIRPVSSPVSRMGVGATLAPSTTAYQAGTVYMACGDGGYAGLVRLEDGRLNIAAALDPVAMRRHGGPGAAVASLVRQAGLPLIEETDTVSWHGTPLLTQQPSRIAGERLFLLGDAAGYVEPFTGEGIAWALASAVTVAPLTEQAVRSWGSDLMRQWTILHRATIANRQWTCRTMAFVLRHRLLAEVVTAALSWAPSLSVPVLRYMKGPVQTAGSGERDANPVELEQTRLEWSERPIEDEDA